MARVFVYGTLMRGAANHDVLARLDARFEREARTAAARTLVDLGPYPALLPADAARDAVPTYGEVYEVDDAALDALDDFEGCPTLYRRETVELDRGDVAFTYVLARPAPPNARPLPSGRYEAAGRALPEGASDDDFLV